MKFVEISWPVSVLHHAWNDAGRSTREDTGTLKVTLTMSDNATTEDTLKAFAEKLDKALKLVDIGDPT